MRLWCESQDKLGQIGQVHIPGCCSPQQCPHPTLQFSGLSGGPAWAPSPPSRPRRRGTTWLSGVPEQASHLTSKTLTLGTTCHGSLVCSACFFSISHFRKLWLTRWMAFWMLLLSPSFSLIPCLMGFLIYSWLTMPCQFHVYSKVMQLYIQTLCVRACVHTRSVVSDSFPSYGLYVAHQAPLSMEFSRQGF